MSRRRVCVLTPILKIGGTEVSTLRLSTSLQNRGHDVRWISTIGPFKDELLANGVNLIYGDIKGRSPIGLIKGIYSLVKIFNENRFEIIHSQDVYPAIMSCWGNKFTKTKAPVIWHLRGIHEYTYPIMAKFAKNNLDLIIANSNFERNKLLRYGCPPEKVKVIYNSIEEKMSDGLTENIRNELGIKENVKIIGSIGRLAWMKGYRYLLEAFGELLKSNENLHLILIGDGEERALLEKLATTLGIKDKVSFLGFRRDIPDILKAMDIFAFPSIWEPFGNVAVEAMYARVPVVASYVGGIPEIITNMQTGFLVPPADKDEWVKTLLYALDNPELCEKIKQNALEVARQKFSLNNMITKIEDLYETLIEEHRRQGIN